MSVALELKVQQRVGHRLVSTVSVSHHPWGYETIVWGGRARDKIAYERRYGAPEEARRGHQAIVKDVKEFPKYYKIGNLY
ncbi:TPA: hypothetical protein HA281_02500 [Candidatus Woesearchaeota archaeon]|nr:hypothetical protein [uncultured archaeon]HIH91647.1 hypothetical protein [Candidatus Woesearchaeota archaeon]HII65142.1 hypothetical protein [Candidatus Woesearchaeota archaeon]HIJ18971.1 hypothetical protein [Candidatus Woesearchaeota archaeon]